jgi:hypothetical protein
MQALRHASRPVKVPPMIYYNLSGCISSSFIMNDLHIFDFNSRHAVAIYVLASRFPSIRPLEAGGMFCFPSSTMSRYKGTDAVNGSGSF